MPSLVALLPLVPLALVGVVVLYVVYELYLRATWGDVDKLPGPPARPFVGTTHHFPSDPTKFVDHFVKDRDLYGREHGVIRYWFGPVPFVNVVDPDFARELTAKIENVERVTFFVRALRMWLGDGTFTTEGAKWRERRHLTMSAFGPKILRDFMVTMNEKVDTLVSSLENAANTGKPFNFFDPLKRCTLDVVCQTIMGVDSTAMASDLGPETAYINAASVFLDIIMKLPSRPWLRFPYIRNYFPEWPTLQRVLKTMHDFTEKVIKERRQLLDVEEVNSTRRKAFLDLLLTTTKEDGSLMTDLEIREEVDTVMFAGYDTTATSIMWAIQILGNHPDVQDKLAAEIKKVVGLSTEITMEHLKELSYLEMVIKETLRLKPTVPVVGHTIGTDVTRHGFLIPAGTQYWINVAAMSSDPKVWGPTALDFDPERWDLNSEKHKDIQKYAFLTFNHGMRKCIGRQYALMEVKIILAKIVTKYHLKSVHKVLVGERKGVWTPCADVGVPVLLLPREM